MKRRFVNTLALSGVAILSVFSLASCNEVKNVTAISILNKEELEKDYIYEGTTKTLLFTFEGLQVDAESAIKLGSLKIVSDNSNCVSISGLTFTTMSEGTATIYATYTNTEGNGKSVSDSVNIKVRKKNQEVSSLSITNKDELQSEWNIGDPNRKLVFKFTGKEVNISQALSDGSLKIESSNTNVVSVNDLTLSAVGEGSATIKVSYSNNDGDGKIVGDSVTIQVTKKTQEVTALTITNKEELQSEWKVGDSNRKLVFKFTGKEVNISQALSNGSLKIESSNTDVVSVNDFTLSAVGEGSATIKVSYSNSDGDGKIVGDSVTIQVTKVLDEVTDLVITNKSELQSEWKVGDSNRKLELEFTGKEVNVSNALKDGSLKIESSNKDVISVNELSLIPVSEGSATITVSYTNSNGNGTIVGDRVTIQVTKKPEVIIGISIKNKVELQSEWRIGDSNRQLELEFTGKEVNISQALKDGSLKIESSNTNVVSIFGVYIAPVGEGIATITAKYTYDGLVITDSFNVEVTRDVTEKAAKSITLKEFKNLDISKDSNGSSINEEIYQVQAKIKGFGHSESSLSKYSSDAGQYGNLFLEDETGETLQVYGSTTTNTSLIFNDGRWKFSNPKDFLDNSFTQSLEIGDEVTMFLIRCDYKTIIEACGRFVAGPSMIDPTNVDFTDIINDSNATAGSKLFTSEAEIVGFGSNESALSEGINNAGNYGNLYLKDTLGNTIQVYGATASNDVISWNGNKFKFSNPKDFLTNRITSKLKVGDKIKFTAIRADYNGIKEISIQSVSLVPSKEYTTDPTIASLVDTNGVLKEKTKITLWSTIGSNNLPYLESYIEDFKAEQPNIEVENVVISGSYNDLKESTIKGITTNSYPDLVACYNYHVSEYIDYDKAINLDKYMYDTTVGWTDSDFNDFMDGYLDEGESYVTEGTYSLPWCKSTEQMFYNEDVLVGLDLSKYDKSINGGEPLTNEYLENLTWDELFDHLCPAIVAHDNQVPESQKLVKTDGAYHAVFAYDSDDNLFTTLAKQYGYGYTSVDKVAGKASIDFNNDGMKSLLKKFNDAAKKGYIISKGSAGGNYTNEYFNKQNALFSVGSSSGVRYQFSSSNPMNVGVARIPQATTDSNKYYTINQGPSLCLLDHDDDNKALASWLFYKFISNEENSLDWALNTDYSPIRYSSLVSAEYLAASDYECFEDKTLERLMAYAKSKIDVGNLYSLPAFKGSSTCKNQVAGLMTKALTKSSNISEIDEWFADALAMSKLAL